MRVKVAPPVEPSQQLLSPAPKIQSLDTEAFFSPKSVPKYLTIQAIGYIISLTLSLKTYIHAKGGKMTHPAFSSQDFNLLPGEKQLPAFLTFLRKGKSEEKSPFPCKVTLKGRGTVSLGISNNTIRGAHIVEEFIVITLKTAAWGKQKYEVFFYGGIAYCRIPDAPGRGLTPEFIIEP